MIHHLRPAARLWLVVCFGLLSVGGILPIRMGRGDFPAASEKRDAAQVADLIRDLASERFQTRESASDKLARIGLPAFAALEEATRHADREVRFRAERILVLIRKNDLERRLAAFLAGARQDDYDLPAWSRFSKAYGDTETSRKFFVEMQRAEPELLAAFHRDPRAAVEVLGRRLSEKAANPFRGVNVNALAIAPAECSAYLFVAAEESAPVSPGTMNLLLGICRQPALLESLRVAKEGDINRQMLTAMIVRCEAEALYPAVGMSVELRITEGLVPAKKLLEQHGKMNVTSPIFAAMALACVVEMGDASYVPAVEKLLEDQSLLTTSVNRTVNNGQVSNQVRELQVRDAALATLVILTKQDPKEYYGQALPRGASPRSPFNSFPVQVVGFDKVVAPATSDPKRDAVFQKWADYKSRNPGGKAADSAPRAADAPAPAEGSSKPNTPAPGKP